MSIHLIFEKFVHKCMHLQPKKLLKYQTFYALLSNTLKIYPSSFYSYFGLIFRLTIIVMLFALSLCVAVCLIVTATILLSFTLSLHLPLFTLWILSYKNQNTQKRVHDKRHHNSDGTQYRPKPHFQSKILNDMPLVEMRQYSYSYRYLIYLWLCTIYI